METRLHVPDMDPPSSISEVMIALRDMKLEPKHEKKDWGDWITFSSKNTVISIESMRGLASSATIEHAEEDGDEINMNILAAFGQLGWMGSDEDGEFRLD
ncbi:MAG TPA: hypothetical protein DEP88_03120 [Verrucomicrobiales bacterium]|nr:hypothetical protein [Verrucomicrobiales bacterium]HCI91752.1 hypothetical protein [Verrucomicrobiales bacterium]HCL97091.1 hypothetical protein [Verrucomicrobiales bacterium]